MRRANVLAALLVSAVVLLACAPQQPPATVRIGSKDFTEQLLLGEMYAQLLEANGFLVQRKLNLPGTEAAHNALAAGEIDLYPEYTGTGYQFILGISDDEKDAGQVAARVASEYEARWNLVWLEPAPMNNTNAIACTPEAVRNYGLKTLSDLAQQAPNLRMAGVPDFPTRPDGLAGLKQLYGGFEFRELTLYEPESKYRAITEGKADCVIAFSTDGQIAAYHLILMQDDRGLWPPYQVAPVVRKEVLQSQPRIRELLDQLAPLITNDAISALNWKVDGGKQDHVEVAEAFLKENELVR